MAFAQLTYRESLRDIEACLRALQPKLYHVGIRARIARSTLADANETRDWRIYADFAQGLIRTARALYVDEPLAVDLASTVYALDATIIDLCLSVFSWAHYRRRDAAIKLHTQLDLRGSIPTVVQITEGKRADVTFLDDLAIEAGAIYIMDRGYVDFARLHRFVDDAAFFVTRTKHGIRFRRRTSRPVDFTTGLLSDHTVGLATPEARRAYPEPLRRVRYVDRETAGDVPRRRARRGSPARHRRAVSARSQSGRSRRTLRGGHLTMWVATRGKVTNDSPLYLIVPGVGHFESASPLSAAWPTVRSAIRSLLDGQLPS